MPKSIQNTSHLVALASLRRKLDAEEAAHARLDEELAEHEKTLADALAHHRERIGRLKQETADRILSLRGQLMEVAADAGIEPDDAAEVDEQARAVTSRAEVLAREEAKAEAARKEREKAEAEEAERQAKLRQAREEAIRAEAEAREAARKAQEAERARLEAEKKAAG